MAAADAYIAVFDAKYTYTFWRPITAIRNGDQHGMPRVEDWEPLVEYSAAPRIPVRALHHLGGDRGRPRSPLASRWAVRSASSRCRNI
jgi:hypothetical protein